MVELFTMFSQKQISERCIDSQNHPTTGLETSHGGAIYQTVHSVALDFHSALYGTSDSAKRSSQDPVSPQIFLEVDQKWCLRFLILMNLEVKLFMFMSTAFVNRSINVFESAGQATQRGTPTDGLHHLTDNEL